MQYDRRYIYGSEPVGVKSLVMHKEPQDKALFETGIYFSIAIVVFLILVLARFLL